MTELAARLAELVRGDDWLMDVLREVRDCALPDWTVAGGAVRDRVFDVLHGREPGPPKDVDVTYFDPGDLDRRREPEAEERLRARRPDVSWDVKNQAAVHRWYGARFGIEIPPRTSSADAIAHWVETATCVGVRLDDDDAVAVVATEGLSDLFAMVLRPNPRCPNPAAFERHLAQKRFFDRWPRLRPAP